MNEPLKNLPASVRARLLNINRQQKRDFQEVLTRFALERLLYRMSLSEHASVFILKGALLFVLWSEELHRYTQDMDLLGSGEPSPERMARIFREICQTAALDDGMVFHPDSVTADYIRKDTVYHGVRVKLLVTLERARIPIQVDIGYGDAVVPEPQEHTFPSLLEFPSPRVRAYARETSIAEKLLALTTLGMDNSRMKDYFDLWLLARTFDFDGEMLCEAIAATFQRQREPFPVERPIGLTPEFSASAVKRTQWSASSVSA